MADPTAPAEYLVISRGQWDPDASPAQIQAAIDAFYVWHARMTAEGRMKPGKRLAPEGRLVSRQAITDGPFAEAKEVVGGYWMIQVASRAEAIEWACRCPGTESETIEVRQVQEMADFPDEIKKVAARYPDMQPQGTKAKE